MFIRPSHSVPSDCPGPRAVDTNAHRAALNEIIIMGTDFARLLHSQATAQLQTPELDATAQSTLASAPNALARKIPVPAAPAPNTQIPLAAAFDQIARAVRRSITLARSLDRPLPPTRDPAHDRTAARQRIIRDVEDRIGRATDPDACDTSATAADLHAELRDRLDAPDLDDDLATRPTADIITEICRDLGIAAQPGTNPWRRRTPADLAHLRARAAAPTPAQPGAAQCVYQNARQGEAPLPPPRQPTLAPTPRKQPGPPRTGLIDTDPIHTGNSLPEDPAAIIEMLLRHPTQSNTRWRPPPED